MIIDTHALIWFMEGDSQLSEAARMAIELNAGGNLVSIASLWEMGIKWSNGKLALSLPFGEAIELIEQSGFKILSISKDDLITLSSLPFFHRDPFDRLLIAQSLNYDLPIVTKDSEFSKYRVDILW